MRKLHFSGGSLLCGWGLSNITIRGRFFSESILAYSSSTRWGVLVTCSVYLTFQLISVFSLSTTLPSTWCALNFRPLLGCKKVVSISLHSLLCLLSPAIHFPEMCASFLSDPVLFLHRCLNHFLLQCYVVALSRGIRDKCLWSSLIESLP